MTLRSRPNMPSHSILSGENLLSNGTLGSKADLTFSKNGQVIKY